MSKILIIDDERAIRRSIREILEYEKYVVDEAEDGMQGLEMATKNEYELIFCDIKMQKMDGIEVLDSLIAKQIDTPIIMISGHGTIENAVDCLKKGAYDFLPKPIDLNRLLVSVRNALDKKDLVQETKALKRKISKIDQVQIIGESEAILSVRQLIKKVAPTDARVMITGENGTGKELVARLLHQKSKRTHMPMLEVNCAAIPSELIESELFGHEKGSFTSAIKQRKGKFELANGGTLFLDEIGDMSLSAQAKLLRALQENKISRVGGDGDISVDVRIVAATNKNLTDEIEKGNFREDLFHRLNVIPIHVPALRDRKDDIPLLVEFFLKQIAEELNLAPVNFDKAALKTLQDWKWPGNIRELRNVVERLMILCNNPISNEDVKLYAFPQQMK